MLARNVYIVASFIGVGLLIVLYVTFPSEVTAASLRGISIWWDVLFPALFPFLVVSEILLGIGIVHAIGSVLDPVMRPLFRVSGKGGFVMAMGFAAGYPVAAKLTSGLRKKNWISREEGERLVSFATTGDPVFILSAVSIGFFHNPSLAFILMIAHYGGAILVGFIMRFHAYHIPFQANENSTSDAAEPLWKRAFEAMHHARLQDGRPFSVLIRDAITSALNLLFVVGGLVVFFSVLMEMFQLISISAVITVMISVLLNILHLPEQLATAFTVGLFEVTLGAKSAAVAGASSIFQASAAALILSWSGLSVHAQVVSLVQNDGIRYLPFLISRVLHSIFSALIVIVLWAPLQSIISTWTPNPSVWQPIDAAIPWHYGAAAIFLGTALFGMVIVLLLIGNICSSIWKHCTR